MQHVVANVSVQIKLTQQLTSKYYHIATLKTPFVTAYLELTEEPTFSQN